MKKTLLTLAAAMTLCSALAADVTYEMTNIDTSLLKGEYQETTYKEDGSVSAWARWQPLESMTLGNYTLTFEQGEATNAPAFYTAKEGSAWTIRTYGGSSMTITSSENLKTIILTTDNSKSFTGTPSTGAGEFADKSYTWTATADTKTVTFSFTGTFRIASITFSDESAEVTPPVVTPPADDKNLVNIDLKNDNSFTFEQGDLPEGLSQVWSYDSRYGLKASAYTDQVFASDAWAISPVVDLTNAEKPALNFHYAVNQFKLNGTNINIAEVTKYIFVNVREEGGEWAPLTIPTIPTSFSWNYIDSGDIDLSAYAGKKIQIGFRYTSTNEVAGTWEIDTFTIKGEGEGGTVTPPVTPPAESDYAILVNNAQEIDGTFVEEQPAVGNGFPTAAHYQPVYSCLIGDYYFSFNGTSDKENQQPALYLPMSTSANGNSNFRMYSGCSMTIEAPEATMMKTITADCSNIDTDLTVTASEGTVAIDNAAQTLTWTAASADGVNKVTFNFDKKIRMYGFNIETGSDSVEDIEESQAVFVIGNSIVAPEGSHIYHINGVETNGSNLAAGIYVVRYGNKTAKVVVK
ncbi:MAG: hypothetical protein HDS73_09050 [Bacteroidales bacterium]|nr:hypothetical protein [Bacteroidales bacterium]